MLILQYICIGIFPYLFSSIVLSAYSRIYIENSTKAIVNKQIIRFNIFLIVFIPNKRHYIHSEQSFRIFINLFVDSSQLHNLPNLQYILIGLFFGIYRIFIGNFVCPQYKYDDTKWPTK